MPVGPVAIGGIGGSGTRVVAEILMRAGLYMGADLNESNDNLWFTLLLKRPAWVRRNLSGDGAEIWHAISIFAKAMNSEPFADPEDLAFIREAARDLAAHGHDHIGSGSGDWALERERSLLKAMDARPRDPVGWGWKEPNTHLFLRHLAGQIPGLRYVHVMRHGLDMAFSANQGQLHNWGRLYGIEAKAPGLPLPKASLQYWIAANRRAIETGRACLGPRFLLLNFDQLCLNPSAESGRFLDFVGIGREAVDLAALASLPRIPQSMGRYRDQGLTIFDPAEIAAVEELGFSVPSRD